MSNKTKIQGHNTALESLKNILAVPMEKHGMYVWRKFKYKPAITVQNPQFDISCSNSAIVTIANPNFDPSKVENYIDFFDGLTATTTSTGHDYFKKENGVLKFCVDSTNYTVNSYDGGAGTFTLASAVSVARTYAYAGTKNYSEEEKTFLDFVVSDIESAYPDGGLKDGYWYERFSLDIKSFGCTKHAVDSFVLTSDIGVGSYYINHSLGSVPIFAMLSTDDESGTPGYIKYGFVLGYDDNVGGKNGCYGLFAMDGGNRFAGSISTANKQQVSIAYGSAKYKAGVKYTLVTMA